MNFPQAVGSCFKKYATFSGRASRSEYWYFFLFHVFAKISGSILDFIIFDIPLMPPHDPNIIRLVFAFILFLPSLSVGVRRLHDISRSGWWILIGFTIIGLIPLMYWFAKKGTAGDNRFGTNPIYA